MEYVAFFRFRSVSSVFSTFFQGRVAIHSLWHSSRSAVLGAVLLMSFFDIFLIHASHGKNIFLPLQPTQEHTRTLELGKLVQQQIMGDQVHVFSVNADSRQFIDIEVYQRGIDLVVRLVSPDMKQITEVDSPNGRFGPERLMQILEMRGEYRIEVRPFKKDAPAGSYDVRVTALRKATEDDQTRILRLAAAKAARSNASELRSKGGSVNLLAAIREYEKALELWRSLGDKYWEAATLNSIGVVHYELGQKQHSLEFYKQSLTVRELLGDSRHKASVLENIGLVYHDLREYPTALQYYKPALVIYKALDDKRGEGDVLKWIGVIHYKLGDKSQALASFKDALPAAEAAADQPVIAELLNNLGLVYSDLNETTKALEFYNRALPLFKELRNQSAEAITLKNLGNLYRKLGESQKALTHYQQALQIRQDIGGFIGDLLGGIGSSYTSLGDYEKALEFYKQSLPHYRSAGDRVGEANSLNGMGLIHHSLGQSPNALTLFNEALNVSLSASDRTGEATARNNICLVYSASDQRKALEFCTQALSLSKTIGNRRIEAGVLNSIGGVYSGLGEQQKALEFYTLSLLLAREVAEKDLEARVLNNIGLAYYGLSDFSQALEFFTRARSIFQTTGDPWSEATVLNNIGCTYLLIGEGQKGLETLNQALVVARAARNLGSESATLAMIGNVHLVRGDKQKALDLYAAALRIVRAIGDRRNEATALNNIGFAYINVDHSKALEHFHQSLPLRMAVGDLSGEAEVLENMMLATKTRSVAIFYGKQSVNAFQQLRSNISQLDKELQKNYLRSRINVYRELANLLALEGRLHEAHQVLNSFKDQQFFDFNRDTSKAIPRLMLTKNEAAAAERYREAASAVEILGGQLTELKNQFVAQAPNAEESAQLHQLETRLKSATDALLSVLSRNEVELGESESPQVLASEIADTRELQSTLRELRAKTGQRSVAVYTSVGLDTFSALLITEDDIKAVSRSVKGEILNQRALQLWALLQSDKYDPRPLAQEIHADVFKALGQLLPKDTTTILWSLDGNLRYLPMGALHDGKQYLVERYNHVVFTRADRERLLRAVSAKWTGSGFGSSKAHTVELLGDKISFDALSGVTQELSVLFRQPGSTGGLLDGQVFPDAKFTKATMLEALKQRRPLVHISSHFNFRPGDEARSFLLLGDGTALTLSEMKQHADLFTGVELLTLSACNTAAQQSGANGREIDGFAELAQRLGAGSVMATLWPVADNSTPWLMREFYRMRQNGLTKAEASRKAQLALLNGTAEVNHLPAGQKSSRSPVQIVVGEGRSREGSSTRAGVVYVSENEAPPFVRDLRKPFAHPYYWAPFILIGNWN